MCDQEFKNRVFIKPEPNQLFDEEELEAMFDDAEFPASCYPDVFPSVNNARIRVVLGCPPPSVFQVKSLKDQCLQSLATCYAIYMRGKFMQQNNISKKFKIDRSELSEKTSPPSFSRSTCKHCNKSFRDKYVLKTHMQNIHLATKKTVYFKKTMAHKGHSSVISKPSTGYDATCKHCNKSFRDKYVLETHMQNIHSVTKKTVYFKKTIGNKSNSDEFSTSSPGRDATPVCKICKKTFSNKYILKTHMATIHSGGKKYQCCFCERKFRLLSIWKRHHNKYHTSLREPYCCEICGKKFTYELSFQNHQLTHAPTMLECLRACGAEM